MHYKQQEWQTFYDNNLPNDQLNLMESHLESCDACREIFISCIDPLYVRTIEKEISADFAHLTMEFIKTSQLAECKHPSARQKRRRMLINYIAAAAVTITLMSGGVFQSAVDQTAQIPRESDRKAAHIEEKSLLFTWPNRLEASTDHWINNMSFTKLKEVKW